METAIDCIIVMDQEGKILEFNRAAEETAATTAGRSSAKCSATRLCPLPAAQGLRRSRSAIWRWARGICSIGASNLR